MSNDLERFLAAARGSVGNAAASKVMHVDRLLQPLSNESWDLDALRGRLVELSARGSTATLTAAMELVAEAQIKAEPVAWIAPAAGTFYPPDVADSGIDLSALVVVRVRDGVGAARVAERLIRSSAFGLVVIDLCSPNSEGGASADLSTAIQGRLVTLAQTHDCALICITEKSPDTASLGSLVSLRAEALRITERDQATVTVKALKDKRRGPNWARSIKRRVPAGL
ncbi:MAG: recombinase A [Kofleriaceae bacterium]